MFQCLPLWRSTMEQTAEKVTKEILTWRNKENLHSWKTVSCRDLRFFKKSLAKVWLMMKESSSVVQKFINQSSEYMCTPIMICRISFLCHFASVWHCIYSKKMFLREMQLIHELSASHYWIKQMLNLRFEFAFGFAAYSHMTTTTVALEKGAVTRVSF